MLLLINNHGEEKFFAPCSITATDDSPLGPGLGSTLVTYLDTNNYGGVNNPIHTIIINISFEKLKSAILEADKQGRTVLDVAQLQADLAKPKLDLSSPGPTRESPSPA